MASRKITAKLDLLLSREKGTIHKDPGGRVSICLVYPNTYHIGMSNLGFQGIYTLLNGRPDVVCERAFLPDEEDWEEHIRTGTGIISMESKRPLNRFDIVASSVSFENDYPNILKILDISRIPLRSVDRKEVHPLLIIGGVSTFFNPEPIADFFDICFIGEAEDMLPEFIDVFRDARDRKDVCERAMSIEGLYLPALYEIKYDNGKITERKNIGNAPERIKRRFERELSGRLRPSITSTETEFSGMYLAEAMRGCPWNCRFCVAGYVYKPVRRKALSVLRKEIESASTVSRRVGLIAPSLSDYPHVKEVLCMDGVDFSITSLRASRKSAELIRFLKGHRSVSIAPEAGTERLRGVIDKRITEESIVETARMILAGGIETLRLYFMVGLPTEEERDIQGIVSLVKRIREASARGNIVLTLSTFVPKPFTPFQWHPMERMETVKNRLKSAKKELSTVKGVRLFHDVPRYAYMQGLFSRGDRRISRVLEAMLRGKDWQAACRDEGLDTDFYLFRKREFRDILPWDFIDNNISKERLWAEYLKAFAGKEGAQGAAFSSGD